MNTLTKLIDFYNNRSEKDYHDLTEQILLHYRKIPEMNIYQLAALLNTSPATISRYIRKIGAGSFNVFKTSIKSTINNYTSENLKMPGSLIHARENLPEYYAQLTAEAIFDFSKKLDDRLLQAFVDKITQSAKTVFMSSYELDFPSLQYDLTMFGKISLFSKEYSLSLSDSKSFDKNTFVLFFVTPDREIEASKVMLNTLKETGCSIGIVSSERFYYTDKLTPLWATFKSSGTDLDLVLFRYFMHLLIIKMRYTLMADSGFSGSYAIKKALQEISSKK